MICHVCQGTGITREGGSGLGGDRDCGRCHGEGELTTLKLSEIAPTRFLMSSNGEAISYHQWVARVPHPAPDVIWCRKDDWQLAATPGLEDAAYQIWLTDWIGAWHRVSKMGESATYEYRERGTAGWNSR